MLTSKRELWAAFFSIIGITLLYLFVVIVKESIPAASSLFGHSLGVLGFLLMLMTEILYSIRKRRRSARWGRMSSWLQFHIYTGIVGPYLVLLHTSWKFNGLAGVLTLLTAVTVFSGFVGRYIYTAVPRTPDGVEVEAWELKQQIAALENELSRSNRVRQAPGGSNIAGMNAGGIKASGVAALSGAASPALAFLEQPWKNPLKAKAAWGKMDPQRRRQAEQLDKLLKRRRQLIRQVDSISRARRLLALWHMVHIPIGMALFVSAFIHAGAAIYYATLLR